MKETKPACNGLELRVTPGKKISAEVKLLPENILFLCYVQVGLLDHMCDYQSPCIGEKLLNFRVKHQANKNTSKHIEVTCMNLSKPGFQYTTVVSCIYCMFPTSIP